MSSVVLFTGGIDSTVMIYDLIKNTDKEIYPLNFNYDQKQHAKELVYMERALTDLPRPTQPIKTIVIPGKEIFRSSLVSDDMNTPDFKTEGKSPTTNVPMRGTIFVGMATAYADFVGADEIYIGHHIPHDGARSPHFDSNPDAVFLLQQLVKIGTDNKVQMITPLMSCRKVDIIRMGISLGVNFKNTWTCYNNEPMPCGTCLTCVERKEAFKQIGMEDPLYA